MVNYSWWWPRDELFRLQEGKRVGMKIAKEQHYHGHFQCNTASEINQGENTG